MSALACLAEVSPNSITNLFVTREYNERGRYVVRLYDPLEEMWRKIEVSSAHSDKHVSLRSEILSPTLTLFGDASIRGHCTCAA